jgi:hypothetical protein
MAYEPAAARDKRLVQRAATGQNKKKTCIAVRRLCRSSLRMRGLIYVPLIRLL